jgi:hypothetical protein
MRMAAPTAPRGISQLTSLVFTFFNQISFEQDQLCRDDENEKILQK